MQANPPPTPVSHTHHYSTLLELIGHYYTHGCPRSSHSFFFFLTFLITHKHSISSCFHSLPFLSFFPYTCLSRSSIRSTDTSSHSFRQPPFSISSSFITSSSNCSHVRSDQTAIISIDRIPLFDNNPASKINRPKNSTRISIESPLFLPSVDFPSCLQAIDCY